ncbi:hypothetical protein ASG22_01300 [Chryseobacterium sp. Leaf405]|uniref:AbiH family protein n=1 Tax=Chryseobacterium sp. Leaf405 TaxID=1736367 RepID=UPI0006F2F6F7|nr:AbiH family protein [Chryseobacterium sp. Leaf405]KQT35684.1 hypothetical protein ASG22_01300 [Chryseobacterium sp. Leaf405]
MNKLIIVGNGFDLAHGLKTKYSDMVDFFWNNFFDECYKLNANRKSHYLTYDDELVTIQQKQMAIYNLKEILATKGLKEAKSYLRPAYDYRIKGDFFQKILQINSIENWVDVENEYYKTLVNHLDKCKKLESIDDLKQLNKNFESIKKLLCKHLSNEMIKPIKLNSKIFKNILLTPDINDFSHLNRYSFSLNNILILNFNYTNTIEKVYLDELKHLASKNFCTVSIIHIHGDINEFHKNPMIFGYGDELDKHSKDIVDFNNSEFLKNVKSINYQFSSNYKDVLQFLSQDKFQATIMGHSCGNSDRTLLNTIFEHENCISIKPYYHAWDGGDNYFDIICNIYRNFTKNFTFREKVVEKNLCDTLT